MGHRCGHRLPAQGPYDAGVAEEPGTNRTPRDEAARKGLPEGGDGGREVPTARDQKGAGDIV
ncbi:hypothetical protein GCM10023204_13860 [Actinomycetospora succinea]